MDFNQKHFFYRVKEDDSILKISRKFNMPTIKLIEENNLVEEVSLGDILLIIKDENAVILDAQNLALYKNNREILLKNKVDYLFCGLTILK